MTPTSRRAAWAAIVLVTVAAFSFGMTRDDPPATDDERAYSLKESTLCPVCDGQNVLESNAPVASAIRNQIDDLVDEGATDGDIRARLAAIYGDDVNPNPPRTGLAGLVWVIPVVVVAVAIAGLSMTFRRWRPDRGPEVSEADRTLVERARGSR